jgi:hypothetical protein
MQLFHKRYVTEAHMLQKQPVCNHATLILNARHVCYTEHYCYICLRGWLMQIRS